MERPRAAVCRRPAAGRMSAPGTRCENCRTRTGRAIPGAVRPCSRTSAAAMSRPTALVALEVVNDLAVVQDEVLVSRRTPTGERLSLQRAPPPLRALDRGSRRASRSTTPLRSCTRMNRSTSRSAGVPAGEPGQDTARIDRGADRRISPRGRHHPHRRLQEVVRFRSRRC